MAFQWLAPAGRWNAFHKHPPPAFPRSGTWALNLAAPIAPRAAGHPRYPKPILNPNMMEAPAATSPQLGPDFPAAPSSAPAIEIRVARTIAEVEAIREIWSAWNFSRDTDLDFCLEFVWSLEGFERPHVIMLYRNGIPDAMLLGRVDRVKMAPRLGYLQLPGMSARLLRSLPMISRQSFSRKLRDISQVRPGRIEAGGGRRSSSAAG